MRNDAVLGNTYVIGIQATNSADPVIGPNTFIYLDTDQNTSTGFSPFGKVGAEYYVQFSPDPTGTCSFWSCTTASATTHP